MGKIEYVRNDAGDEVAMKIDWVIRGLDRGEQRLLWQTLTLCVLGPMLHDDDDLLLVCPAVRPTGRCAVSCASRSQKQKESKRLRNVPFRKVIAISFAFKASHHDGAVTPVVRVCSGCHG
jgi:hypothetical protein